ncbi:DUF1304 domain-containing protein [Pedobacter sp. AW31-3R]|uniref:DUF1304 domain-containing protein n=1 Tax=Pedobacter sp. AW31-3R TaxID=3445781 RepID=UPI003FA14DAB
MMEYVLEFLIGCIAVEHLYILWMEMFAWETRGKKTFGGKIPADVFKHTKSLAANQGLYNGFLVAGLLWTFFIDDVEWKQHISVFFLGCVAVAGVYGALTASRKIFFLQALPAILALVLLSLM